LPPFRGLEVTVCRNLQKDIGRRRKRTFSAATICTAAAP
jgi:hypothetical protein